jgi:hypothetical protein
MEMGRCSEKKLDRPRAAGNESVYRSVGVVATLTMTPYLLETCGEYWERWEAF